MRPRLLARERELADHIRPFVLGEAVRDFTWSAKDRILFPYDDHFRPHDAFDVLLWPWRTTLAQRATFQGVMSDSGLRWSEYMQMTWAPYATPLSLVFAFVATHNHFVLDRGGKVFKQSAPVIKLPADATEDDYLDLLGVLNSSTACFWLKQVSHNKGNGGIGGGIGDEDWEPRYEFTGTKLQEFPLPASLPRERARLLDGLAVSLGAVSPSGVVGGSGSLGGLNAAHLEWDAVRARMVFAQEELDWEVSRSYGLLDADLTYAGSGIDAIALGSRAFEIALARSVESGSESTAWFARHGSTPLTSLPSSWPADYAAVVEERLALISSDPFIGLLERPEFKRRWASASWESLERDALRGFVLDRLEEPGLWSESSGPRVMSVAQLADRVRGDVDLVEALRLLAGAVEVDVAGELGSLLSSEAVPFLAAHRYKDSGLRVRAEWESVWALQRREDAGEKVSIPVPPKYKPVDFRKPSYWQARGKLDVPKERFVLYPGAGRAGDNSLVLGWAGWDQLEQARALATLIVDRSRDEAWAEEKLLPLVAGLVELEPWLHQWFDAPDPLFGGSPAAFITGFIDDQLTGLGKTRDDAKAWRP